jgi:predicted HicB family RNase H-like nuclease
MRLEVLIFNFEGYLGSCKFDPDSETYHGRILGIEELVTYEASSSDDLYEEFIASVNDYLETCVELNEVSEKPSVH